MICYRFQKVSFILLKSEVSARAAQKNGSRNAYLKLNIMKANYPTSLLKGAIGALPTLALLFTGLTTQAQLSVDTGSREQSRVFYNAIYPASENAVSGWNGNVANGNAGTTTEAFKEKVFLRINFFRAFSGIYGEVTNNPTWSAMDQSAALMMAANNNVDHTPPTSWKFYSSAGATAAGKSSLALSNYGPDAITSYMEDPGNVNAPVGHRRWILFPQTQQMGTGDIPASGSYYASNALWTLDLNHYADERPVVRDTFIAWPPKGYVPYQLIYPRWSFAYPNANFSGAQVTMTQNGSSIPVRIESRVQGYGEKTLVFVPNNLNPNAWTGPVKPANDTIYSVRVSNVVIDDTAQTFEYDVRAFDPAKGGPDTPNFDIIGSASPKAGIPNTYSVMDQVLATGYQWKYSTKAAYTTVVGAETSGDVIAKAPSGYSFRDPKIKALGRYSYHLVHRNFIESSFMLSAPVLCSNLTKLNFSSRLAYATVYQTATVEVSTDGGNQWAAIWSQKGTNNAGQSTFATRSLSLAAYSGREVFVRFRYALRQGSAFTQTDPGVGWYVDNVTFTKGEKLVNTQMSAVSVTPLFNLSVVAGQTYVLQVRAQVFGKYYRDWSVSKTLTGVQ